MLSSLVSFGSKTLYFSRLHAQQKQIPRPKRFYYAGIDPITSWWSRSSIDGCPNKAVKPRKMLSHLFAWSFLLSLRTCRCGRLLTSVAIIGRVVHGQGCWTPPFVLESVAARICRKQVDQSEPMCLCATFGRASHGQRRDWRSLSQLAVDTTLVCALHADVTPRSGAAASDGVALKAARWGKEVIDPELVSQWKWGGGREGSSETHSFQSQRVRQAVPLLQHRAEQAECDWVPCWHALLLRWARRLCLTFRRKETMLGAILACTCVKPLVHSHVCQSVGPFWVHFGSIMISLSEC